MKRKNVGLRVETSASQLIIFKPKTPAGNARRQRPKQLIYTPPQNNPSTAHHRKRKEAETNPKKHRITPPLSTPYSSPLTKTIFAPLLASYSVPNETVPGRQSTTTRTLFNLLFLTR